MKKTNYRRILIYSNIRYNWLKEQIVIFHMKLQQIQFFFFV